MLRCALMISVLSLLLGCTEHRLAPGEVYDLENCRSETIEITNLGPGRVEITARADVPVKQEIKSEWALGAGESRVYRAGTWLSLGLPGLSLWVKNVDGQDTVVRIVRESMSAREWNDLSTSGGGSSDLQRAGVRGEDPADRIGAPRR